jgi:hypothetical protein
VRARHFDLAGRLAQHARLGIQIEFQGAGNHDDGLGPMSILEHREPERLRPVDEQAAAKVLVGLERRRPSGQQRDFVNDRGAGSRSRLSP